MPYPSPNELKAVRIDTAEYENMFLDQLLQLMEHGGDRNADWWPFLLENWKKRYERWYMTLHGTRIVYFSAVQKMTWDSGIPELNETYYRLMTRTWSGIRKIGLESGVIKTEMSPAMLALGLQLEDFPDKNRLMTMEYTNRRSMMQRLAEKVNIIYNGEWQLREGMYFTCTDFPENRKKPDCWQCVISERELPFDMISTEQFINMFGNRKKS
jgi:hypothetical protein